MKELNYSRFLNNVSVARKDSAIRAITKVALNNLNILSVGPGWPNPSLFPFQSAHIATSDGMQIVLEGKEMEDALQYTNSKGTPQLVYWMKKIQNVYHDPPRFSDNFDVCVTNGGQDGVSKAFSMLGKPGDYILLDNPCYPATLSMLRPYDYKLVPIETDKFGMRSDCLLKFMQQWSTDDVVNFKSDIPKYIYTIPTCSNPTGVSASLERKNQIYKIAQKYDMLIIEDDPYFFMQFGARTPSYQSLDVDGRVIRCDSLSKTFTANCDLNTPVTNRLLNSVVASSFCLYPMTWQEAPTLRLELIGTHNTEEKFSIHENVQFVLVVQM